LPIRRFIRSSTLLLLVAEVGLKTLLYGLLAVVELVVIARLLLERRQAVAHLPKAH
jgi:hypothetical protein